MAPCLGLTLAWIVLGPPLPAGVPADRVVGRIDLPFGTAVLMAGRTIVYERPADRPKAPPAQAAPPAAARPAPDKPFSRAEVEKLVRALRAAERDQQERVVPHTRYLARYLDFPPHHPQRWGYN